MPARWETALFRRSDCRQFTKSAGKQPGCFGRGTENGRLASSPAASEQPGCLPRAAGTMVSYPHGPPRSQHLPSISPATASPSTMPSTSCAARSSAWPCRPTHARRVAAGPPMRRGSARRRRNHLRRQHGLRQARQPAHRAAGSAGLAGKPAAQPCRRRRGAAEHPRSAGWRWRLRIQALAKGYSGVTRRR